MTLSVKGCWSKLRYKTREAAEEAARVQAKQFEKPFRVYPCGDRRGKHFHTTSKNGVLS